MHWEKTSDPVCEANPGFDMAEVKLMLQINKLLNDQVFWLNFFLGLKDHTCVITSIKLPLGHIEEVETL